MGSGQVVPYGFGARGTSMLVNSDLVLGGKSPRGVRGLLPRTQNPHTTGPNHNRPVHTHRKHYPPAPTITGSSHKRPRREPHNRKQTSARDCYNSHPGLE